jgi:predicted RND superfamily exporter protein
MKNLRNFMLAVSVMVGISLGDSEGIGFVVAAMLCLVPAIVLGIEEWNKKKEYERAKANSENLDYLTDLVMFGEWNMEG